MTPDEKRAYWRAYYHRNKEKRRAEYRAYYHSNKEKRQEQLRASYQRHKEKRRADKRAYYKRNREKLLEQSKAYRERNREKLLAYYKAYNKIHGQSYCDRNREKVREKVRRRRARMDGGTIAERDWRWLVNRHDGLCAYCYLEPWAEQDHVVPLSRGGRHTIGNVLPACRHCNATKSNRLLAEWRYSSAKQVNVVT